MNDAAIHFAKQNMLISANMNKEFSAYIYKVYSNGEYKYYYSKIVMLGSAGGDMPGPSVCGVPENGTSVALIHTHCRTSKESDYRFSIYPDKDTNDWKGIWSSGYLGMYLVAGNGTLQYLPANAKKSDTIVQVISTEMPIIEGAMKYEVGSEQIYKAVEVEIKKKWYKRIWPWVTEKTYTNTTYKAVDEGGR